MRKLSPERRCHLFTGPNVSYWLTYGNWGGATSWKWLQVHGFYKPWRCVCGGC